MKNWGLAAAALAALSACGAPTAQDLYGRGPVPNKAFVDASFQKYLNTASPGYMFVSETGNSVGYSYCPSYGCSGLEMRLAQDGCLTNSRGSRCFVYARDNRVVWDENAAPRPKDAIKTP